MFRIDRGRRRVPDGRKSIKKLETIIIMNYYRCFLYHRMGAYTPHEEQYEQWIEQKAPNGLTTRSTKTVCVRRNIWSIAVNRK